MKTELQLFSFPLSLILAAALFSCILLSPKRFLRTTSLAVLLLLAAGFAVVGSLENGESLKYLLAPLILATIYLSGVATKEGICRKKGVGFILGHLGICILLGSSLFAAPDCISSAVVIEKGKPTHLTADGFPLPFEMSLVDVHTEFYPGKEMPKQYHCSLEIDSRLHKTCVNHPVLHKGWLIYLSDFDRKEGTQAMLRVVRDPSIPGVLIGMVLLALSALLGVRRCWKSPIVLPATILLAVLFSIISLSRIHFSTLPPALRSFWFAPHVIVYMIAYSTLALSLVSGICHFIPRAAGAGRFARPLLETSSHLILLGIIFGSIWAQLSWGDYWAWDAKECWAATTYLLTLCAIHLPQKSMRALLVTMLLLTFAAMQITWYGVNLLPSAQKSMHTYNIN